LTLSEQDSRLFFKLFLPLLKYVSQKLEPEYKYRQYEIKSALSNAEYLETARLLWKNDNLIDEYLAQLKTKDVTEDERAIIEGWKRHVTGHYIIERHFDSGSVLINLKTHNVYLVKGLTESWQELLRGHPLPAAVEATLLPFKDVIISDGLISISRVVFGNDFKEDCNRVYRDARRNKAMLKNI